MIYSTNAISIYDILKLNQIATRFKMYLSTACTRVYGGNCYVFHDTHMQWVEADNLCINNA